MNPSDQVHNPDAAAPQLLLSVRGLCVDFASRRGTLRALDGLAKDGAAGAELSDISSYMAERHKGVTKEHVRFHLKSLLAKNLIAKVRRGRFTLAQAENSASLRAAPQDAAGAWAEQDNVSENDVLQ